jgi:hypothetical protein
MISNPTAKGKRSEAAILAALVHTGYSILLPWGEERFDLVAYDRVGRYLRVQCKTGRLRDGCVEFKTCVTDMRRPNGDGGYHGQIDAFGVFCPQTGMSYLVPISDVACLTLARLRVDVPRNGQSHGIRWAEAYELPGPAFDKLELVDLRAPG